MTDSPAEDLRSELQKQEEADAAAFEALPKAGKIAHHLDSLIAELQHQVKHNGPVAPGHIQRLRCIRELLG